MSLGDWVRAGIKLIGLGVRVAPVVKEIVQEQLAERGQALGDRDVLIQNQAANLAGPQCQACYVARIGISGGIGRCCKVEGHRDEHFDPITGRHWRV